MALDEDAKRRIEEEERVRIEARAKAQAEVTQARAAKRNKTCFGCLLGLVVVFVLLYALGISTAERDEGRRPRSKTTRRDRAAGGLAGARSRPRPKYRYIHGVSAKDAIAAMTDHGFYVGERYKVPGLWFLRKPLPDPDLILHVSINTVDSEDGEPCIIGAELSIIFTKVGRSRLDRNHPGAKYPGLPPQPKSVMDAYNRACAQYAYAETLKLANMLKIAETDIACFVKAFTRGSVDAAEAYAALETMAKQRTPLKRVDPSEIKLRTRVAITSVENGSSAERIGLKPGDVVMSCAGVNVSSPDVLAIQLSMPSTSATATLPLIVRRDGKLETLYVAPGRLGITYAYAPKAKACVTSTATISVTGESDSLYLPRTIEVVRLEL